MRLALAVPVILAAACATTTPPMDAPASLAAAETAFAAQSVRENMRPAFLAHFSEDGVTVRDGAWVRSNEYLKARKNPPIVLDWRPAYVEVSLSGDLGVSTGPWKLTSVERASDPPSYGQFVSIWRREGQAPWKVEVDLGIRHPQATLWEQPLEAVSVTGTREKMGGEDGLRLAEQEFSRASAREGARAGYAALASERFRFYRDGAAPAIGKAAALAAPGMVQERLAWNPLKIVTSDAGDFGYARGNYASADAPARVLGQYLRVWRFEAGAWRVALDVTNPAPH